MPNWCENELTISGDKEQLAEFEKLAKSGRGKNRTALSLAKIVPVPKELKNTRSPMAIISEEKYQSEIARIKKENIKLKAEGRYLESLPITKKMSDEYKKKFGADNWYEWNCKNWGTKWDVTAELTGATNTEILYYFDSAWAPPVEWLKKASEKFPELEFTLDYKEPGMGFRGTATAKNGEISDECENYEENDEDNN